MLTVAIGDIHGCFEKLVDLMNQCKQFLNNEQRRIVFVGDYIDRGPNSVGVLEDLIDLERNFPAPPVFLMGNHEQMLLQALSDPVVKSHWLQNGGAATLENYVQAVGGMNLLEAHIEWLKQRPLSFDDGRRFFVHAGIDPNRSYSEQDAHDLLWMREPFLSSNLDFGRLIVHGHTPTADGLPEIFNNRVNIDTGAVHGGPLTAAVFSLAERRPIAILQSSAE